MKMLRNFGIAAALALIAFAVPAQAASVVLCSPTTTTSGGSKRVVNPNTSNAYTLSSVGCALIAAADVGYFQSQGYSLDTPMRSMTIAGQTAAFTMTLPAGAIIRDIIAQETSGASVTGGLKIGTTAGGTDVATGMLLPASTVIITPEVSMSKRVFSATAPQTLFVGAVSSFNSSAVNLTVVYEFF